MGPPTIHNFTVCFQCKCRQEKLNIGTVADKNILLRHKLPSLRQTLSVTDRSHFKADHKHITPPSVLSDTDHS